MAEEGRIKNFTGIDSRYEPSMCPDITLNFSHKISQLVPKILIHLKEKEYI